MDIKENVFKKCLILAETKDTEAARGSTASAGYAINFENGVTGHFGV